MTAADPVLTVAEMRAAEQALIDGGETVSTLMERAGLGAADWIWRIAAGRPVTVLCGPGNNGGDGYVIARELRRRGSEVTLLAPLEPATDAARAARDAGGIEPAAHGGGGVLVDCLFGSGLTRPLSPPLAALLAEEAGRHPIRIAVDLPSGIEADSARSLNPGLPRYDATLALGAWKFAHVLMPAMTTMGAQRLVPIGIAAPPGSARLLLRPQLEEPGASAHKYTRGLVLVVAGRMHGAALLACEAAMRAGAGAVRLAADGLNLSPSPDLVIKPEPLEELLGDGRTGAVLIGPGLGRDASARAPLAEVLAAGRPTVLDAEALALLGPADLAEHAAPLLLTPHEGELEGLLDRFAIAAEGKVEQARRLAAATGAVVVAKGPDTVIAAPDGRLVMAPSPTSWLSVAGTGDVLAGIVASRLAAGSEPLAAACEAVWLHGEAARLAGPAFVASDLARHLPAAYAAAL